MWSAQWGGVEAGVLSEGDMTEEVESVIRVLCLHFCVNVEHVCTFV